MPFEISEASPAPSSEEWAEIFKQLAEVNLLKVAWINNDSGIRKFSAFKIFRVGMKHSNGNEFYNYVILKNEKKPDLPKMISDKYMAVRISDAFIVMDKNGESLGTVAKNFKLIETHPFSISMTATNNKLRWAVIIHDD